MSPSRAFGRKVSQITATRTKDSMSVGVASKVVAVGCGRKDDAFTDVVFRTADSPRRPRRRAARCVAPYRHLRPRAVATAAVSFVALLFGAMTKTEVRAFTYHRTNLELQAPEMICVSGLPAHGGGGAAAGGSGRSSSSFPSADRDGFGTDGSFGPSDPGSGSGSSSGFGGRGYQLAPCPQTPAEVEKFPAVVIDEHGYVTVKLTGVRMRDDGRRRGHGGMVDDGAAANGKIIVTNKGFFGKWGRDRDRDRDKAGGGGGSDRGRRLREGKDDGGASKQIDGENTGGYPLRRSQVLEASKARNERENESTRILQSPIPSTTARPLVRDKSSSASLRESYTPSASSYSFSYPHHLQVYLVPLDEYASIVDRSQCCYELELGPPFPDWVETERGTDGRTRAVMPSECSVAAKGRTGGESRGKGKGKSSRTELEMEVGGDVAEANSTTTNNEADIEAATAFFYAHDYRVNAPRTGRIQKTTAPISVNDEPEDAADEDGGDADISEGEGDNGGGGDGGRMSRKRGGKYPLDGERMGGGGKRQNGINLAAILRPSVKGRHMVVISNCAADMQVGDGAGNSGNRTLAVGLRAVLGEVEVTFVSKFGELPLSMMGIIPFYGTILALYGLLAAVWWRRSCGRVGASVSGRMRGGNGRVGKGNGWDYAGIKNGLFRRGPSKNLSFAPSGVDAYSPSVGGGGGRPPLLGIQRAIRALVFAQTLFSALAFAYYLHLNVTYVDVDTLYSGTAAALVSWDPWSATVAAAHFCTILGCQTVVTLATDGTWLIQHHIRPGTRRAVAVLVGAWLLFFALYGVLHPRQRAAMMLTFGMVWVIFLLYNVRRSLRHLRSLMIGQGSDTIMAVGGALVAKRSLYRKICAVVAVYPLVFLISVIWNARSQQDSWTWLSYVLVDIYVFIILVHASVIWMPRPMAGQEYIKYAPLEISVAHSNDLELWEENVREEWNEEEIEMEHPIKVM